MAYPVGAAENSPTLPRAPAKRRPELELARVVCCVFIVFIHVAPIHRDYPFGNYLFIMAKCCATQVFFLIMGAFLSAKTPFGVQLKRLLEKHTLPFLVLALVIIQLWPGISRQVPLAECFTTINVDFRGFAAMLVAMDEKAYSNTMGYEHYLWVLGIFWFMFALYKCYFFYPVLKPLCVDGSAEAWVKRYVVILGGALLVAAPSLRLLAPDSILATIVALPESPFLYLWTMLVGNHVYAALGDPLLGEARRRRARFWAPALYFFCVTGIYLLTWMFDTGEKGIQGIFLERGFIFMVMGNIAAFAFFCAVRIRNERVGAMICSAANKVFYVYLVHMAVDQVVIHWICPYERSHPLLPRLAVTAGVTVASYGIACFLRWAERGVRNVAVSRFR